MAEINRDILIPYLDGYKEYLDSQERKQNARPLSNVQEDYKRGIAQRAADILKQESWAEEEIGKGIIGKKAISAVGANLNLVGRFQVTSFSDKVKEDYSVSERILYDLYHDHKEGECFEQICRLFGRKYDLVAYLYFVLDPSRYLPLRSSIFDRIFKKVEINLQTSGRCTWDNYQEYLATIAAVRDVMKGHYQIEDIDLLDAHSFLWTLNLNVLGTNKEALDTVDAPNKEKAVEVGASVYHKDLGEGTIYRISEENIYVEFGNKQRIFPYPEAFDKEYLKLI